jgi:hypothetical protein
MDWASIFRECRGYHEKYPKTQTDTAADCGFYFKNIQGLINKSLREGVSRIQGRPISA